MQTHTLLFCLVGLLSCISGLNAYMCQGCLDRQTRCHGNGATWYERRGEYKFRYRCRFVQRNGNTKYRSEVIDAGCIVNGQMLSSGQEWIDQERCAKITCVKSGNAERKNVHMQVHSTGCRTGGSCKRDGEEWNENCLRYQCQVTGDSSPFKRYIGRDPSCVGKKRQN